MLVQAKMTMEELYQLHENCWFQIYDNQSYKTTPYQINFHKFSKYLTSIPQVSKLATWTINPGPLSDHQIRLKRMLTYLKDFFSVQNLDQHFLDFVRFYQKLKVLSMGFQIQVLYCQHSWKLGFIREFLQARLVSTYLRLSKYLKFFFRDIYYEKNFRNKSQFQQIKSQITSGLTINPKLFSPGFSSLFEFLDMIFDIKKSTTFKLDSIVYELQETNVNLKSVIDKMLDVMNPDVKKQQQLNQLLQYEQIRKYMLVEKVLEVKQSANRNINKKRQTQNLFNYLRQLERDQKQRETQYNKQIIQENTNTLERNTKLSHAGTKRGTFMSFTGSELDQQADKGGEQVKQNKQSKKVKDQFEKLNDCKAYTHNKQINIKYKNQAISSFYAPEAFRSLFDQIEYSKRKRNNKIRKDKDKQKQMEDELDKEAVFYKQIADIENPQVLEDIFSVKHQDVRVSMNDIKGAKKAKQRADQTRKYLKSGGFSSEREIDKGLVDEARFIAHRIKQHKEDQDFLQENLMKVVLNENNPENQNKQQKEKDRNLFYFDYAEDSEDEADIKAIKAKKKAVNPYDWRKVDPLFDPMLAHSPFQILQKSVAQPIQNLSASNFKAGKWGRVHSLLKLSRLNQRIDMLKIK